MPVYEYKALNADGKSINGIIDAENPKVARTKLRKQGIFPTDVFEGKAGKSGSKNFSREIDFKKYLVRIGAKDISIMTRQLATLVGAGIPLIDALTALIDQIENEKLKVVVTEIRQKVNEGSSLSTAMSGYPVFPNLFTNMITAGEQSGALDVVLYRLADYSESQIKLKGKVTGALTYPLFMMMFTTLLMGVLFVFVIPKITKIFKDMKIVLPMVTRILIGFSEFVSSYWWLVIIMSVASVYVFYRYIKSDKGSAWFDRVVLKVPVFGNLIRMVALSRFSKTLSTLLHSGVPLLNALNIVESIVNNKMIATAIEQARESIQQGHSISEPLKRSGQFPALATHMIAIGEKTGQLEPMLDKVSEAYENQVDSMINTMTTLLEPFLIVIMGGAVMFIALSILLPMLQITQSIH